MQQADDVSSYALEDRPRIHGVRSLMSYSIINEVMYNNWSGAVVPLCVHEQGYST